MNFIPDVGDRYYCATRTGACFLEWGADPIDIDIARGKGIFPYTREGRKLATLQHALMIETVMFWEWLDDYVL